MTRKCAINQEAGTKPPMEPTCALWAATFLYKHVYEMIPILRQHPGSNNRNEPEPRPNDIYK